jgi:hypothetical protein
MMMVSVVLQLPIHFDWASLFLFFIHRFLTMSAPRGTRSAKSTHMHDTVSATRTKRGMYGDKYPRL